MTLPSMRPKARKVKIVRDLGRPKPVRCKSHLKWVAGHFCSVPGCWDTETIVAHHVRLGSQAPAGKKPGDDRAISLCHHHHIEDLHRHGEDSFAKKHGISLQRLAADFASNSPALRAYMNKKLLAKLRRKA